VTIFAANCLILSLWPAYEFIDCDCGGKLWIDGHGSHPILLLLSLFLQKHIRRTQVSSYSLISQFYNGFLVVWSYLCWWIIFISPPSYLFCTWWKQSLIFSFSSRYVWIDFALNFVDYTGLLVTVLWLRTFCCPILPSLCFLWL
jgi:hypothetical protein